MNDRDLAEFIHRARGLSRRAAIDAATLEIFAAFDVAKVEAVLLKGPVLARVLYGAAENRAYNDVDLLVAPDHLGAARTALGRLGYEGGPAFCATEDAAGVRTAELWWRESPTPDAGAVQVDLHWRLTGMQVADDVAWSALTARRASIEVDGRRVPALDRSGLALHLALHAAQHGPDDLKTMGDLARGLATWPIEVWRLALDLATVADAVPAFAAGLRLVPEGADLATELELPSTARLDWAIVHREERPRGAFHLEALMRSRSMRSRLLLLRRSLFPARAWIVSEYPWAAKGRGKAIAAYTAHVLRAPQWTMRAWRYRRRERAGGRAAR